MFPNQKVALTMLVDEDKKLLWHWINDRELVLFNSSYKPVSWEQHNEWFESIRQRKDVVIFAIRLLKKNKLIGTCQLHNIHQVNQSAELQIRIGDKSEQSKGYGTEAVRLLLDFGFKDLNLHSIYLRVFSTNPRAIAAYKKNGFQQEGSLREAAFIDGKFVNIIFMSILRAEYG